MLFLVSGISPMLNCNTGSISVHTVRSIINIRLVCGLASDVSPVDPQKRKAQCFGEDTTYNGVNLLCAEWLSRHGLSNMVERKSGDSMAGGHTHTNHYCDRREPLLWIEGGFDPSVRLYVRACVCVAHARCHGPYPRG